MHGTKKDGSMDPDGSRLFLSDEMIIFHRFSDGPEWSRFQNPFQFDVICTDF